MPITSFHILDASSIVQLASLHFVPCDIDTQAEREELFAEGTQELWGGDEAQVLFSHAGDFTLAVKNVAGLVLILAGKDDCDEESLEEIMPVFQTVLNDVLEGNVSSEQVEASRAKVLVALNEIVHLGYVANTDPAQILKLAKMKPLD